MGSERDLKRSTSIQEDNSLKSYKEDSTLNVYKCYGRVISKYFKEINVRRNPLPNANVIAVVKVGTKLSYIPEQENDFYPVKLNNGQTGYMMMKFIEEVSDE